MCYKTFPVDGKIISFADDTVLIVSEKTWKQSYKIAGMAINKIKNCLDNSLLTLNNSKTKYLTFSATQAGQPLLNSMFSIKIHCCVPRDSCDCIPLERVTAINYLGLTIDNNLRWQDHIETLTNRILKLGYIYRNLRKILKQKTLKTVYFALTHSLISYGIVGWGGCAKTILEKLCLAQRCIVKIIIQKPFDYPTENLYNDFKVFDPRQIYIQHILTYFHKNIIHHQKTQQSRTTRTSITLNYIIPHMKTTFGQRNASFIAPRIYNTLPMSLKVITSHTLFKTRIKKYIGNYGRTEIAQILNIQQ